MAAENRDKLDGYWGEESSAHVDVEDGTMAFHELGRTLSDVSQRSNQRRRSSASRSITARLGLQAMLSPNSDLEANNENAIYEDDNNDTPCTPTPLNQILLDNNSKSIISPDQDSPKFNLHTFRPQRKVTFSHHGVEHLRQPAVVWKNLTVKGVDSSTIFNRDIIQAITGTFGPDVFNFIIRRFPSLGNWLPGYRGAQLRNIIDDFSGSLDKEMLLVLGRPGSGCSTFLKAIASQNEEFASTSGNVYYAGLDSPRYMKKFPGDVVYNHEADLHFPTLTVGQTLWFAIRNNIPRSRFRPDGQTGPEYIQTMVSTLLKMLGIEHTENTPVGNEYIRGVSGGERKRVSIAEVLATRASFACWDNSTRGLDSSTALDYVKSLKLLTEVAPCTTIATLYQAGEKIYQLFDKVLLIHEGRCIFFGPANQARSYFESLGYQSLPQQTTPDFLTALTNPTEAIIKPGFEKCVPKTSQELRKAYLESQWYTKTTQDIARMDQCRIKMHSKRNSVVKTDASSETTLGGGTTSPTSPENLDNNDVRPAARGDLNRRSIKHWRRSVIAYFTSVWLLTRRQFWLKGGDMSAFYTKTSTNIIVSLIVGAMFYNAGHESMSLFPHGGALFFSLLFLGWLNLAELIEAHIGQPVIIRHKKFNFYRPSAVCLARVLTDVPLNAFHAVLFCVIFYFLASLRAEAGAFFKYLLIVLTMCLSLTSLFRAIGTLSPSIDSSVRFSVMLFNIGMLYAGYAIPRYDMAPWFGWITWVQPISYGFEALIGNEVGGRTFQCSPSQIVPSYSSALEQYQTCLVIGAEPGSLSVNGDAYLDKNFGYKASHYWRNFGIIVAFLFAYVVFAAIASEVVQYGDSGNSTVFVKNKRTKKTLEDNKKPDTDEEKKIGDFNAKSRTASEIDLKQDKIDGLAPSESIFTWKDINYWVPYGKGKRQLLTGVSGWIKPGEAVALMGPSGAGKTTLLNLLSLRLNMNQVTGDILVDGKEPGIAFPRHTGFAEQADVHDKTQTVREAFEFSALLRQPENVPREEKLAYVDKIIDLLELNYLEDALIGTEESGLTVEQRKRVTIGVELVAKPSLLTFLDEPTSGLDSSGAWQIGRFLRRLANSGQTALCTLHQPSSELFGIFDRILLLEPGGRVAFFGPVNELIPYFERHGMRKADYGENIAEFALETVTKGAPSNERWGDIWLKSEEYKAIQENVDKIVDEYKSKPAIVKEGDDREHAASTLTQCRLLTIRIAKNFWRDPSYAYGKIASQFIVAVFVGFSLFDLGHSVTKLQERMFSVFFIILVTPALANASIPKHYDLKGIWSARESKSKTYSWFALITSILINEIPYAFVIGVLYWVIYYWPIGWTDMLGEKAVYSFLMIIALQMFIPTWIHWLCSISDSPGFVFNALPFFLVVMNLVNGIIIPYSNMIAPWKYFVYYANPITYVLSGLNGAALHNEPVICTQRELAILNPPSGQTCQEYLGDYLKSSSGSLYNPNATSACEYCQYTTGDDYLESINSQHYKIWYYYAIAIGFCISNVVLVYVIFYLFQVRDIGTKIKSYIPLSLAFGGNDDGGENNDHEVDVPKAELPRRNSVDTKTENRK